MLLLTACQPAAPVASDPAPGAPSSVGGTAQGSDSSNSSTPALGIDLRVPPTRPARSSPVATASPAAGLSVTLADDGRTITVQNGQRLLLNLGNEFDWTVDVEDESIVSRVPGVTVVAGAQGIYAANRVGKTALSATGDPLCRKQQPACAQPSRAFKLTIAVQ